MCRGRLKGGLVVRHIGNGLDRRRRTLGEQDGGIHGGHMEGQGAGLAVPPADVPVALTFKLNVAAAPASTPREEYTQFPPSTSIIKCASPEFGDLN